MNVDQGQGEQGRPECLGQLEAPRWAELQLPRLLQGQGRPLMSWQEFQEQRLRIHQAELEATALWGQEK